MNDLNDPLKTCIYIPPGQSDDTSDLEDVEEEDVGFELRMKAYRVAWTRCLERMRSILKSLHTPVVQQVSDHVSRAYTDVLPGLPYPELPVIALFGANSALLTDIMNRLDKPDGEQDSHPSEDDEDGGSTLQVHLYPAECNSVMNTMKALVTGFVDRRGPSKRKPTSLASFDINLLRTWYLVQDPPPRLTVFLHEFEKFDSAVMQDVFYICSVHVPQLPLVFVLVMTSPPSPSFIHSAYPRSTLSSLRIHQVAAPSGLTAVRDVLIQTFFEPDFEPDLMLGPGVMEYIVDFAYRHTASPDALITMLQLAHMKHFSLPLTIFIQDELLGTTSRRQAERTLSSSPTLQPALSELQARLLSTAPSAATPHPRNTQELFAYISTARDAFQHRARHLRTAFAIARLAERVALGEAPVVSAAVAGIDGRGARLDSLGALSTLLRGRAGPQVHYVCMAVKKLSAAKLRTLLHELHSFWNGLASAAIRNDEADARLWVIDALNKLPESPEPDAVDDDRDGIPAPQDASTKALAREVGEWLEAFIEERLARLDECALWDVWYTGGAPFPAALVNPAPRATAVAALLHPHDFVRAHAALAREGDTALGEDEEAREPALWELPDTSIAFRRYVEAGRMVNVFDWFESFAVVLESQRRHLRRRARGAGTPSKVKVNGKGKGRATPATTDGEDEEEMDEEEEERWKVEVQARFIRALHELDYMGFVRHTGRKADHVIRTIYDVPD